MRRLAAALIARERTWIRWLDWSRRARLLARIRLLAAWKRTTIELDVAPDLRVGRDVRVKVAPRSHVRLRIGPGCRIGDEVRMVLIGGALWWGDDVQLRVRSSLHLSGGELRCEGANIFSYGNVIHCVESVRVDRCTAAAEYVTIVDSSHFHTVPDTPITENTKAGPIRIGKNVFLAPRVSVGRGVSIGDYAVVGPNSTVIKDLPAGVLASGVPAVVVRALDLPWERA